MRAPYTRAHHEPGSQTISKTTILAILALPAGAIAYTVAAAILAELGAPDVVLLLAPLFVAGLCMAPFLIPFFDRMAKRDLAALQAQRAADADSTIAGDDPRD